MSECCVKNDATGLAAIRTKTEPIKTNDIVPLNLCVGDGSSKNEHARPGNLDSRDGKSLFMMPSLRKGEKSVSVFWAAGTTSAAGAFPGLHPYQCRREPFPSRLRRFFDNCNETGGDQYRRSGCHLDLPSPRGPFRRHPLFHPRCPAHQSPRKRPSSSPVPRLDAASRRRWRCLSRFFGGR